MLKLRTPSGHYIAIILKLLCDVFLKTGINVFNVHDEVRRSINRYYHAVLGNLADSQNLL